jgi:hypothetical protein
LWLTQEDHREEGNALWFNSRLNVTAGFTIKLAFSVQDTNEIMDGGLALVFRAAMPSYGEPGAQLGYGGLTSTLAVELDMHMDRGMRDPNDNHVSYHAQGENAVTAEEEQPLGISDCSAEGGKWYTDAIPKLADGMRHTVQVTYDEMTRRLITQIDGQLAQLSCEVDWVRALTMHSEHGQVYMGLTASTGRSDGATIKLHSFAGQSPIVPVIGHEECFPGFYGVECMPEPPAAESFGCQNRGSCGDCVSQGIWCCGWCDSEERCTFNSQAAVGTPSCASPSTVCNVESPGHPKGAGVIVAIVLAVSCAAGAAVLGAVYITRKRSGLATSWRFWTWFTDWNSVAPVSSGSHKPTTYSSL